MMRFNRLEFDRNRIAALRGRSVPARRSSEKSGKT